NLNAGIYSVTVTDANGCTLVVTVAVNNQNAPVPTAAAASNVACNGDSTGSATVTVSGGTAPFTYSWSPLGGSGVTASNLTAGIYYVTVTDSNGCVASDSALITQPPPLISSITSATNDSCNGSGNGAAIDTASGGIQPYI